MPKTPFPTGKKIKVRKQKTPVAKASAKAHNQKLRKAKQNWRWGVQGKAKPIVPVIKKGNITFTSNY